MEEEKEIKEVKENKKQEKKEKVKEETVVKLTKEEIEGMNLKLKEAEDKALRAQAELINYRKRKDEEVSKMLMYSNEDIVMDILPILDNFERALGMDGENTSEDVTKFLDGMKMIYTGLISTLNKYGVSEIEALGKPFDETFHQAVTTEEVKDAKPNTIIEVYQKGYMLKDKVIRPAMVKVSK